MRRFHCHPTPKPTSLALLFVLLLLTSAAFTANAQIRSRRGSATPAPTPPPGINVTPTPTSEQCGNEILQAPWSGELLGTGAKRPDVEQLAWAERNMIKTREVRFNSLGLDRINEHRAKKGHQSLPD